MITLATRLMIMLLFFVLVFGSTQADEGLVLKKKFFPGHYLITTPHGIYGMPEIGSKEDKNIRQLVSDNPYFTGYHNRYHWHHLEPARGVYDFSKILADLAIAVADGKKMSFILHTKRNVSSNPFPLPNYMNPDSPDFDPAYADMTYNPGRPGAPTDEIFPNICSDLYTDRLVELFAAMGAALDSHPALSSVGIMETGQGSLPDQPWYTQEQHVKHHKRVHDAAAAAFPTTIIHQTTNWRAGMSEAQADEMMERAVNVHGMSFGSTDISVSPTVSSVQGQTYSKYYPMYRGVAPIIAEAQSPTYQTSSARGQFDLAVNEMNAHSVKWLAWRGADPQTAFTIHDVIEVVNAEQGRTASGIPSSLILQDGPSRIPAPTNLSVGVE